MSILNLHVPFLEKGEYHEAHARQTPFVNEPHLPQVETVEEVSTRRKRVRVDVPAFLLLNLREVNILYYCYIVLVVPQEYPKQLRVCHLVYRHGPDNHPT